LGTQKWVTTVSITALTIWAINTGLEYGAGAVAGTAIVGGGGTCLR